MRRRRAASQSDDEEPREPELLSSGSDVSDSEGNESEGEEIEEIIQENKEKETEKIETVVREKESKETLKNKRKDEDPATVPTEGKFFLHDDRHGKGGGGYVFILKHLQVSSSI